MYFYFYVIYYIRYRSKSEERNAKKIRDINVSLIPLIFGFFLCLFSNPFTFPPLLPSSTKFPITLFSRLFPRAQNPARLGYRNK